MLSRELLIELKQILKEDFNLALNDKEVAEIAMAFISYFELLTKIQFKS